jgi:ubiquinol-cytochrome c reductase cytochrome b subunit
MPGRLVRRSDYLEKYHKLTHTDGVPFVPYGVWKDAVFSGVILLCIAGCALYFGPFGPSGQPDPTVKAAATCLRMERIWIRRRLRHWWPFSKRFIL